MKKIIAIIISALILVSCTTVNMNSPRCLEPGQNGIGVYGLYIGDPVEQDESESNDKSNGTGAVHFTFRHGFKNQNELGLGAGSLGGDLFFKHNFLGNDSSLYLTLIGSAGYLWWLVPEISGGVLSGIDMGKNLTIYGGYRQHILLGEKINNGENSYGHLIGGIELMPEKKISLLIEFNQTTTDIEFDENNDMDEIYMNVVGLGFNCKF